MKTFHICIYTCVLFPNFFFFYFNTTPVCLMSHCSKIYIYVFFFVPRIKRGVVQSGKCKNWIWLIVSIGAVICLNNFVIWLIPLKHTHTQTNEETSQYCNASTISNCVSVAEIHSLVPWNLCHSTVPQSAVESFVLTHSVVSGLVTGFLSLKLRRFTTNPDSKNKIMKQDFPFIKMIHATKLLKLQGTCAAHPHMYIER